LRSEKADENLALAPEVYIPKPTKAEKNVIRILECGHFYAKKHSNVKINPVNLQPESKMTILH
jgi:hypothetical protein